MIQILLYAVIGFCATAGTVGLAHVLLRVLHRPETYYKEQNDG